jgi:hypothetical protein
MHSNDRGALIALAIALWSICFVVLITNPAEDMGDNILYHYQTLFAAAVALAGAFIGALAINRQNVLQQDLFRHDRAGKMAGARAMLPLALSSISQYAEECSELLIPLREQCDDIGILPEEIRI